MAVNHPAPPGTPSGSSAQAGAKQSVARRLVLVVCGPTASGKTALSLRLAERLQGEIISADSRQIYQYMDVGTAKPSVTERKNIPHFCLDELTPDREFNAGEFGKRGRGVIDEIFDRKNIPIVVGGSGLYIRAIIDGFFEGPSADPELRAALYREAHETGNERMLQALAQLDPEAARGMLPSNIRRIVRALEVYKLTGSTISELHKAALPKTFTPLFFGLRWDRRLLYRRIDERVDRMLEGGLMDEVLTIQRLGYTAQMNALQTVGYKEAFEHLDGKTTFEEMAALIKRNSRRYAKRQMTWFRRDGRIQWFDLRDEMELTRIAEEIVRTFRSL